MSLLFSFCILSNPLNAQTTMGVTGLLNSPSATFSPDGTVKLGGNYLNAHITPASWDYDTFNYFASVTFLPFVEVGLTSTLLSFGNYKRKFNNVDRAISVRVRALKEGRWWPAVAIGSNDLLTSTGKAYFRPGKGNKFFGVNYIALSKHFDVGGGKLGLHTAFNMLASVRQRIENPISGGISYSPSFAPTLNIIAEYDTRDFNIGANITIYRYFYLQAILQQGKYFSFGSHFNIPIIK